MSYNKRTYAIVDAVAFQREVDAGELSIVTMFENIIESSLDTLRYSVDGTMFIIKSSDPDSIAYLEDRAAELEIPFVTYDHKGILAEVAKPEWTPPDII